MIQVKILALIRLCFLKWLLTSKSKKLQGYGTDRGLRWGSTGGPAKPRTAPMPLKNADWRFVSVYKKAIRYTSKYGFCAILKKTERNIYKEC